MKRAVVAVLGCALLLVGIALLVLPGPGFLMIAAALGLLATQFDWAKRPLDYAKDKAQLGVEEVAESKFRASFAALCALGLVALGVLDLVGIHIPLVNIFTAVMLVLSGLFLVGTVAYALYRARSTAPAERPARS